MNESRKRNIIIASLCGVLLLMAVGYAAFQSVLNIEGTANITSNWDIKITNIEEKEHVGSASSVEEYPKYDNLTATFNVNLVSPGDSISYDVTIENQGNLDAELARIKVNKGNNPAIKFETSGIEVGDVLEASGNTTLTVKVTYDSNVTSQPESRTSNLQVTLDYVQEGKSSVVPEPTLRTVYGYNYFDEGIPLGEITIAEKDYKTDYKELNSYKLGRTWFLKYDIDESNVIQNGYVCQEFTFIKEPVCLQFGSSSYFDSGKKILESLQPTFESNRGNCTISETKAECRYGDYNIAINSNGMGEAENFDRGMRCIGNYDIMTCDGD